MRLPGCGWRTSRELDPSWDPPPRSLAARKNLAATAARLAQASGMVVAIAADITARITALSAGIAALERQIAARVRVLAPALLAVTGVAELTAAKIIAETAGADRFKSKDAYARHNGTAPLPVWSGNHTRHRLSRTGNRQLNCALHRIAVTQKRCHPPAQAYLARRTANGNTNAEGLRALKRRLSDTIYRALLADSTPATTLPARAA